MCYCACHYFGMTWDCEDCDCWWSIGVPCERGPNVLLTVPCRSKDEISYENLYALEEYQADLMECGIFADLVFPTEPGYGYAIKKAWIEKSDYDVFVTIDNDLATPLHEVSFLIHKVLKGYDVVVGARQNRLQSGSPIRGIVSRTFNVLFAKVFATGMTEHFSGFRAFSRRFVEEVLPECEEKHWMFQPESVVVAQALGYYVTEIPVNYDTSLRPTKLRRMPKDAMDIIPGFLRLLRNWK